MEDWSKVERTRAVGRIRWTVSYVDFTAILDHKTTASSQVQAEHDSTRWQPLIRAKVVETPAVIGKNPLFGADQNVAGVVLQYAGPVDVRKSLIGAVEVLA